MPCLLFDDSPWSAARSPCSAGRLRCWRRRTSRGLSSCVSGSERAQPDHSGLVISVRLYAADCELSCGPHLQPSELSQCAPIRQLNSIKAALDAEEGESLSERAFSTLFPFADPGHNALLATFYISSFPNLLLAAMPADIDPQSLKVMSAFAVGALFGDIALHLLPHSFLGEPPIDGGVQVVVVEPKRNIVISLSIFVGFISFYLFERFTRFFSSEGLDEAKGGHNHGYDHPATIGSSSSIEVSRNDGELRKRGNRQEVVSTPMSELQSTEAFKSKAVGAILNLVADATHNCVDALTVVAAFYASPVLGASTAVACFAHVRLASS